MQTNSETEAEIQSKHIIFDSFDIVYILYLATHAFSHKLCYSMVQRFVDVRMRSDK